MIPLRVAGTRARAQHHRPRCPLPYVLCQAMAARERGLPARSRSGRDACAPRRRSGRLAVDCCSRPLVCAVVVPATRGDRLLLCYSDGDGSAVSSSDWETVSRGRDSDAMRKATYGDTSGLCHARVHSLDSPLRRHHTAVRCGVSLAGVPGGRNSPTAAGGTSCQPG